MYPSLKEHFAHKKMSDSEQDVSKTSENPNPNLIPNLSPNASINSNSNLMLNIQRLSLSDLFKFIHPFDGTRDELASFISKCNSALMCAIPDQYPILLQYILTQITGKAGVLIANHRFSTWDELRSFLQINYQDQKHHTQLICELTNLQQKPNESITNLVQRTETLLKRLTTSISQNTTNATLLPGRLDLMNEIAISRFTHFTHPKISDRLRGSKISNLNEAITIALAEESSLKLINHFPSFSKVQHKNFNSERKFCQHCKTNTHNTDKCYAKRQITSKIHQIQSTNFNSNSYLNSNIKICAYCKRTGHIISECRKRQYNENMRKNGNKTQEVKSLNGFKLPVDANTEEMVSLTMATN